MRVSVKSGWSNKKQQKHPNMKSDKRKCIYGSSVPELFDQGMI